MNIMYWVTFPLRLAVVFCCAIVLMAGICTLAVIDASK